jgi:hypothetical protein
LAAVRAGDEDVALEAVCGGGGRDRSPISVASRTLEEAEGRGSPQPAAQKHEPKKPASGPKGHAIGLQDIDTVKDLVERVGAGSLRKLIDVMAR